MADHQKKYSGEHGVRIGPALRGNSRRSGARPSLSTTRSTTRDTVSDKNAGWEAYRGWLSKMDPNASRRRGARSIYTWKGYKAWAANIRASWDADK